MPTKPVKIKKKQLTQAKYIALPASLLSGLKNIGKFAKQAKNVGRF